MHTTHRQIAIAFPDHPVADSVTETVSRLREALGRNGHTTAEVVLLHHPVERETARKVMRWCPEDVRAALAAGVEVCPPPPLVDVLAGFLATESPDPITGGGVYARAAMILRGRKPWRPVRHVVAPPGEVAACLRAWSEYASRTGSSDPVTLALHRCASWVLGASGASVLDGLEDATVREARSRADGLR